MQPLHKNWQLERDLSFFQLRPLVKGGVATRIVSQSSVCRDAAAPRNHVAATLQAAADPGRRGGATSRSLRRVCGARRQTRRLTLQRDSGSCCNVARVYWIVSRHFLLTRSPQSPPHTCALCVGVSAFCAPDVISNRLSQSHDTLTSLIILCLD